MEDNKELKRYEVTYDDTDLYAVSLVDKPAIESNFIYLSKQLPKNIHLESNEKRLVIGAALIPDFPIYRNMDEEEFYIQFSSDTIEKLSQKFLMNGYQLNVNANHKYELDDISVVESWIKVDMECDKSLALGLDSTLPIGTWFISMKINNDEVWEEVKEGVFKGFSIEAFASLNEIKLNKITDMKKVIKQEEQIIVNDGFWEKIKQMIKDALKEPETADSEAEVTAEQVVEDIKVEEVQEVVALNEEVARDVADDVEQIIESESVNKEEEVRDLEVIVDELEAKINELNAEITELKKQNQKLSKQPSTKPVKVAASSAKTNSRDVIESLYNGTYFKK